jgi:hypothetical protein
MLINPKRFQIKKRPTQSTLSVSYECASTNLLGRLFCVVKSYRDSHEPL